MLLFAKLKQTFMQPEQDFKLIYDTRGKILLIFVTFESVMELHSPHEMRATQCPGDCQPKDKSKFGLYLLISVGFVVLLAICGGTVFGALTSLQASIGAAPGWSRFGLVFAASLMTSVFIVSFVILFVLFFSLCTGG